MLSEFCQFYGLAVLWTRSAVQIDDEIVRLLFGLTEIDREKYRGRVFTPEIGSEKNRGRVSTHRKDCKID